MNHKKTTILSMRWAILALLALTVNRSSAFSTIVLDSLVNESKKSTTTLDSTFFTAYIQELQKLPSAQNSQRIIYAQKGISLAESTNNGDLSAIMVRELALFYGSIDSVKIAGRLAKRAYQIAENPTLKRDLAGWTAIYASFQSEYQTAIEYYLKEIAWSDTLGEEKVKGAAYNNIAELFLGIKRYDKAKDFALQAYQLDVEGLPEFRFVSYAATVLGQIYQAINDLDSAEYFYQEAVDMMSKPIEGLSDGRFYHMRTHTFYHLSRFYRETGQAKRALMYADSSIYNYTRITNLSFEYSILNYTNLAKCYLSLGRLDEAQAAIANIDGKVTKGSISYELQALYYEYKVDYALATENYREAFRYKTKLEQVKDEMSANEKEQYLILSLEEARNNIGNQADYKDKYEKLRANYNLLRNILLALVIPLVLGAVFIFMNSRRK